MSVHVPSLIVSNSFLMYCFPWFAILPSSPPQLQGPVLVCIALAYPSLVDPTCGPSMPRGGSDDTYFLQINPKFLFLLFTFRICAAVTQKWNPPPPHNGDLHVLRIWDAAHCTSSTSHPPDIGYSLYPISGPCSFSKFIACCITCRGNGIGSFSLISPAISLLNSKVTLSSSVYVILWGICIPNQTFVMSVFILVAVILSLPHSCLSLWKHSISICLVHTRTWCCKFLHTMQYSVFTSSWRSFSTLLSHLLFPSILGKLFPSCHICASRIPRALYRPNRSLPSIVSGICIRLRTRTLIVNSVPTARFVSGRSLVHLVAWKLCPPRGREVVVHLTVNLETFRVPP